MFAITQAAQERTDEYITNSAKHPPLYQLWNYELDNLGDELRAFSSGLRDVMSGKPLNMYTHRWYWQPTRIIGELPDSAGHGAIAEMPYFTFLYGDLHAHMIAFPITLLVILWLVAEIIGAGYALRAWWEAGLALGIGALAVGVLRPDQFLGLDHLPAAGCGGADVYGVGGGGAHHVEPTAVALGGKAVGLAAAPKRAPVGGGAARDAAGDDRARGVLRAAQDTGGPTVEARPESGRKPDPPDADGVQCRGMDGAGRGAGDRAVCGDPDRAAGAHGQAHR